MFVGCVFVGVDVLFKDENEILRILFGMLMIVVLLVGEVKQVDLVLIDYYEMDIDYVEDIGDGFIW